VITCSEAVRQLWEYLDGVVGEADRAKVEEHLAFCRRCCGELEFAHELRGLLGRPAVEELPADVHERLARTLDDLEGEWAAT
jgi:mycothiol system anti-sigma-R factor